MAEQIVRGTIQCLKCNEQIELYASTPSMAVVHLQRVIRLLVEHWANNCKMSTNPDDYF